MPPEPWNPGLKSWPEILAGADPPPPWRGMDRERGKSGLGAGGGGEVPSLALSPGFPAGTTEASRHSGREAGSQAREGKFQTTPTPAVSQLYTQRW